MDNFIDFEINGINNQIEDNNANSQIEYNNINTQMEHNSINAVFESDNKIYKNANLKSININNEKNIEYSQKKGYIQNFIKLLLKKLDNVENTENTGIFSTNSSIQNQEKDIKLKNNEILVLDRFEGNYAICEIRETQEFINIEKAQLPENVKEGDILVYRNNTYEIDEKLTTEIEERIKKKFNNLFED